MPKAEVWDYWTNVPGGTRRLWAWACDDLAGQDFQSFEDAMHDCTIKVSAQLYSVQFDGQREGRPGQSRHVTASAPEHEKGQALEYAESSEGRNVRLGRGKSLPDGQAALTPSAETREVPSGMLLCIIPGPTKVLKLVDDGIRWCFGCRAHLPHTQVLLTDKAPSYYDPVWVRRCSRCGHDRTAFPGSAW